MPFKRTFFSALGIVAMLLIAVILHHRSEQKKVAQAPPALPDVSVVDARVGKIAQQLAVAGIFQPFQEIDVHGKVSGYIRHINVAIGDRVRQGQTLAVLEVPELQAEVAGAQAGVSQSQDQIARLGSDVSQEQAAYGATHANYV